MRAGRAEVIAARHNDVGAFEDAHHGAGARGGGTGRAWIAVESLYSMDGDRAPLADLVALADRHDALLLHRRGARHRRLGPGRARPRAPTSRAATTSSCCTPAARRSAASGALVAAPAVLRDFLVNRCRPFIYATAPSPLMAAAVRARRSRSCR